MAPTEPIFVSINPPRARELFVSQVPAKMASVKDTASFFTHGTPQQFEFVLALYPQVLKVKAEKRHKKPEELIKLDDW